MAGPQSLTAIAKGCDSGQLKKFATLVGHSSRLPSRLADSISPRHVVRVKVLHRLAEPRQ